MTERSFSATEVALAARIRNNFKSVLEPHERLGHVTSATIIAIFSLHPEMILQGYNLTFKGDVWKLSNAIGEPLHEASSALVIAEWLENNSTPMVAATV